MRTIETIGGGGIAATVVSPLVIFHSMALVVCCLIAKTALVTARLSFECFFSM